MPEADGLILEAYRSWPEIELLTKNLQFSRGDNHAVQIDFDERVLTLLISKSPQLKVGEDAGNVEVGWFWRCSLSQKQSMSTGVALAGLVCH
eukprot:6334865-Amphidinium_carterae.1